MVNDNKLWIFKQIYLHSNNWKIIFLLIMLFNTFHKIGIQLDKDIFCSIKLYRHIGLKLYICTARKKKTMYCCCLRTTSVKGCKISQKAQSLLLYIYNVISRMPIFVNWISIWSISYYCCCTVINVCIFTWLEGLQST